MEKYKITWILWSSPLFRKISHSRYLCILMIRVTCTESQKETFDAVWYRTSLIFQVKVPCKESLICWKGCTKKGNKHAILLETSITLQLWLSLADHSPPFLRKEKVHHIQMCNVVVFSCPVIHYFVDCSLPSISFLSSYLHQ